MKVVFNLKIRNIHLKNGLNGLHASDIQLLTLFINGSL